MKNRAWRVPPCLVGGPFQYGSGPLAVLFRLRFFGGNRFLGLVVSCSSRSELAHILWRFRAARRAVPRSSRSLWGLCFKPGSLRWAASFNCVVQVLDSPRHWRNFHFVAPAVLPR